MPLPIGASFYKRMDAVNGRVLSFSHHATTAPIGGFTTNIGPLPLLPTSANMYKRRKLSDPFNSLKTTAHYSASDPTGFHAQSDLRQAESDNAIPSSSLSNYQSIASLDAATAKRFPNQSQQLARRTWDPKEITGGELVQPHSQGSRKRTFEEICEALRDNHSSKRYLGPHTRYTGPSKIPQTQKRVGPDPRQASHSTPKEKRMPCPSVLTPPPSQNQDRGLECAAESQEKARKSPSARSQLATPPGSRGTQPVHKSKEEIIVICTDSCCRPTTLVNLDQDNFGEAAQHNHDVLPAQGQSPDDHDMIFISSTNTNSLTLRSSASDIEGYLYNLVSKYGKSDDPWWFDVRPVGFTHGDAKNNWRIFSETQSLQTYKGWLDRRGYAHVPFEQYNTLFGFFVTWTKSIIPQTFQEGERKPWHAWGAARVKNDEPGTLGKNLVIWDSSGWPEGKEHSIANLISAQQDLVDAIARGGRVNGVWFGGPGNIKAGLDVQLTADWAERMMATGGLGPSGTWEAKGYKRLKMFRSKEARPEEMKGR
jgi:hypothetical protein